jgi:hypothetical protein
MLLMSSSIASHAQPPVVSGQHVKRLCRDSRTSPYMLCSVCLCRKFLPPARLNFGAHEHFEVLPLRVQLLYGAALHAQN